MRLLVLIIPILSLASCSGQSDNDKLAQLIKQKMRSKASYASIEVESIEFIQDVTVADSLKITNESLQIIQNTYNRLLKDLQASERLAERPRSKLYYSSGKVNKYQRGELDRYVSSMKKTCNAISELNRGWNGDLANNQFAHLFEPIISLKGRKSNEVVGKMYKARIKYSFNHSANKSEAKTEYVLFDKDEKQVVAFLGESDYEDNFKINSASTVELDIKEFTVTDDGIIKPKNVADREKESYAESDGTMILKYIGGEFLGSCMTTFEDQNGDEVIVWNANLGEYENPSNSCSMRDDLVGKRFKVTYEVGTVTLYMEDVGESQIENEIIITSIKLID
ncbi:MAG: hypothetical protein ACFHU9_00135 [Fluviicola sp.]